MKEEIYSVDHIKISYDPETRILFCVWVGSQTDTKIRTAGQVILDTISAKNVTKILNDNQLVVDHWYDSVDWAKDIWFKQVFSSGVKYFAWVVSNSWFANMSIKSAMPPNQEGIKLFKDEKEAKDWLQQLPL